MRVSHYVGGRRRVVDNGETVAGVCERDPVPAVQPPGKPPAATVPPVPPVPTDPGLVLSPATRLLWRSPTSIHLEHGRSAVVVDGLPVSLVRRLAAPARLDRVSGAEDVPVPDADARLALQALVQAGYLWPRPADADDPRYVPPAPRLAGELTALTARHGQDAAQVLNARRHASVHVFGTSRVAAPLAAVLAAAGVGRVHCAATGDVRLRHAAPGGVLLSDEGSAMTHAARQAVHRAAPDVVTDPLPADESPDLTILAAEEPVPDERRGALHAADAAHLAVTVGVDHGVVGPLVLPGFTSCLNCADLHRRDRDPTWPALAVQLTIPQRYGPACEIALVTTVAGIAAMQALAFLDGAEPAVLDATLELHLPDWRVRRRSWPIHQDCDCTAPPG